VAAPTPASDGFRVFAFYSSCDLVCIDLAGNPLWYRALAEEYPHLGNDTGMSSSPLAIGQTVIVQMESQGNSLALGIDVTTGANRWQHARRSVENWSSPVRYRLPTLGPASRASSDLGLLQSPWGLTLLDPRTGRVRWQYELPCASIPSLAVDAGLLYVPAGGITALRIPSQAGVAAPEVVWRASRLRTDAASPLVDRGKLYTLNNTGVLTCSAATTGQIEWRLRLKGRFWATPVLVGSHLVLINSDGLAQVVDVSGSKGKLVRTSDLGEPIQATPAVAGGALYFRSDHHLWKFAPP